MCVCVCSYTEDLVALAKLSAEVRRSSGQDEGDEDALSILSSHDVEAQPCGAPMDQHPPRIPDGEGEEGGVEGMEG